MKAVQTVVAIVLLKSAFAVVQLLASVMTIRQRRRDIAQQNELITA